MPTHTRAAAAAALPIVQPDDADLLALGRRWEIVQAEWMAIWAAAPPDVDADDADVCDRSGALFREIMATPARTIAGLAVKARLLAVAMDATDFTLPAIIAKAAMPREDGSRYNDDLAAFGLAADILRLEQEAAGRDPMLVALAAVEHQASR